MSLSKNIIAIGRSNYLYAGIQHLISKGYLIKAIISEEAYDEYSIKHDDFKNLADSISARFFMTRTLYTDEIIEIIRGNNIEVAISVNWKYKISKKFLDLFQHGILNYHLGNLPDYKGNATVNWSIINGEDHIFANIHKMDPLLDAGNIIVRKPIPITQHTYIGDILKQAELEVPLLYEEALHKISVNPEAFECKGDIRGLRCYPRLPEDSQIDWKNNVDDIYKLIRASSSPYQGAFTFFNDKKLIIWKARPFNPVDKFLAIAGHVVELRNETGSILVACNDGLLEVLEIEYEGNIMVPQDIIKSIRIRLKYKANAFT